MEERGLTKGNLPQQNAPQTQRREGAPSALERIREAAAKDKEMRFTALLHHIYDLEMLRAAYFNLKREAAAGVDGETWRHYGEQLEENLQDLADRVKRGAYRAKPVRRVYIPKADGRQRPLGVTTLEDKCSSAPRSRCSTPSMRLTSSVSRTASGLGAARIMRWMRSSPE
jgi:retron-type reverse transcriptase